MEINVEREKKTIEDMDKYNRQLYENSQCK